MLSPNILPSAEKDMDRIASYYTEWMQSPEFAQTVIKGLYRAIYGMLAEHPDLGKPLPHSDGYRQFLVHRRHWVIYRQEDDELVVRRVIPAKQFTSPEDIDL